ncbi:Hypothetical protein HVIM_01462 [Roseomonas mucosa]|uniref:Uncharacterized protein n=1 Tax=Roseomonas mucosa TaxID=207340 RepID=A0A379N3K2_9PROT|nr:MULTISPECIES: hypothetical protein [Roseomonas]MBS5902014.1 hypothetical protein [Acetobacteraceae bacterium]MCG7352108.1 hypothetical protein [Roseomonas mucosa]MCG7355167.1 hypothetical protein [Roseomonas mucosa]MDT8288695.1 hypothetical protein [Roseomonas mucosa]MDT8292647.1 hypothetical protein [Roseomonas mucosa]
MPSLPSPDLLDLGRYAISRDGRMQPAAGRPPLRFHFLWRGRPVHLRLTGGALEFLVEVGGIPSSAEGRVRRQAVFARLEQMSGEMPPGWELRLDPAHRLWLQASAAPAAPPGMLTVLTGVVDFALELDARLEGLDIPAPAGRGGAGPSASTGESRA